MRSCWASAGDPPVLSNCARCACDGRVMGFSPPLIPLSWILHHAPLFQLSTNFSNSLPRHNTVGLSWLLPERSSHFGQVTRRDDRYAMEGSYAHPSDDVGGVLYVLVSTSIGAPIAKRRSVKLEIVDSVYTDFMNTRINRSSGRIRRRYDRFATNDVPFPMSSSPKFGYLPWGLPTPRSPLLRGGGPGFLLCISVHL